MPRLLSVFSLLLFTLSARADGDPVAVTFEKDVLPVLKDRCFKCHDAQKQRAGLRLDVRTKAFAGGESGKKAIVPGKPGESELVRRIQSRDELVQMPPTGERLTAAQETKLRDWIAAGAKWPDALANEPAAKHWAFVPPQRPKSGNSIDNFVRARLQKEGLKPAPEADKVTLVRRLHLDLIGLPPTPKEVDEYLKDTAPDAYEKLVDKLLASPHYGERWGRWWLDAARYADSDGFEKDKPRFVWFYRDWVINALNRDLPYDQFIIEQLAGDLLPNATQDQRVATGFLRNSMINEEGGIDPEQFRMEAIFDRMDAIGKAVLGLTIQCAQCHTHKYDPFTHTEYYRLFAFLNNAHEASAIVYTPEEQAKRAEVLRKVREIEGELKHRMPNWRERMTAWEAKVRRNQPTWRIAKPTNLDGSGGQKTDLLSDGSILASGYSPSKETSEFVLPTDQPNLTALRLEVLNDPSLPRGGPGRSTAGLFGLSEIQVSIAPADKPTEKKPVKLVRATSDADPPDRPLEAQFDDKTAKKRTLGPAALAIDGKTETGWTIDVGPGRSNVSRNAVFVFEKPVSFPKGAVFTVKLVQSHGGWNSNDNQTNNLGRFRFALTDAPNPAANPLPAPAGRASVWEGEAPAEPSWARGRLLGFPLRHLPGVGSAGASPSQQSAKLTHSSSADEAAVFARWRTTIPEWKAANEAIEAAWKEHPVGASQLVLMERAEARPTHVLKRGDFLKPAEKVAPGVPAVLHEFRGEANRLGFARWLVDRNASTTARAVVNRVWQAYFGAGLVATPEDFGTQGESPTHPELLDWLAVELMDPAKPTGRGPWALKPLHKLIVTSATYKQSSRTTQELARRDPQNKLLARGPRFRVDAEVVRDIALLAGGLLNPKVGGPSVYPPIPQFLTLPPASYGTKTWPEATGPDRYRRSLYVFRFRSVPYPVLQVFDAPNGDFACVKRSRSNTPLQALTVLNEPIFVEAARGLALRTLKEPGTDAERLSFAFRCCVSRSPTDAELAVLMDLLKKQRERFATALPTEAAAWVAVARVLLNLDETMTKE